MNTVVGFTIFHDLMQSRVTALQHAQERALVHFGHLERSSIRIGRTQLDVWGHRGMSSRLHQMPDGSLLVLVGSTHGRIAWDDVQDRLRSGCFELPWDGRLVLIHVSADGKEWTMWNDWLGSIPVFHARIGHGRVASTLEPVTVAAAGYTSDDFHLPGLVSLLINGHFISDWTLYDGMKTVLPDSVAKWSEDGYSVNQVWSVKPSQSRWETSWDELVDEMQDLSYKAIADILKTQSTWILPLSSGMDSRLIAAVAADVGADVYTYAWGGPETTDVVYSREIAKKLGFPWKRIELPREFLIKYTPKWADLFGSSMHFHGMYQMAFLDEIQYEPAGPVFSGFIGEVLAGDSVNELSVQHSMPGSCQVQNDWYIHWTPAMTKTLLRHPVEKALEVNAAYLNEQMDMLPGIHFQKFFFLELWSRQRFFTNFQSTLSDYWRGVANPFMSREYARFCLSLPRVALDDRRLLADVFRRYYGRLAVIPGTYAKDPFILTGTYLLKRRLAEKLHPAFHRGPLKGFGNVQLRMDIESIQASGRDALWPIFETREKLLEWLDFSQLERDFQTVISSKEDIRPLRRLQSVQTLAYRLLSN